MLIEDYDDFVDEMLVSELDIRDAMIAISEEVGEACGKVKRLNRGDYGPMEDTSYFDIHPFTFITDMGKELGDILYYLTAAAHTLGYSLEDVMEGNKEKLLARKEKNAILGQGDNR